MRTQQSIIRNTALMFAAMFISKALGAVLKIPLGNILGGEGMGFFTTAYSIFTPVLSFACAGIPTILTRNVAACAAGGEYEKIFGLRKCSLLLALMLGTAGTVLIYIIALPFVVYIANSPDSLPGVLIIAPATLFCSVTAVYRGYYEGLSDTLPTAVSQVIEASVKAMLGVGLSYLVYSNGEMLFGSQSAAMPYAAAAAILGVTVSEMCGTLYMFLRTRKKTELPDNRYEHLSFRDMMPLCKDIFIGSLPISLGAAAANLLGFADMITISNCIDISAVSFENWWSMDSNLSAVKETASGAGNFMYGCYAGIIMSVYLLAASASGVIGRCELPRLTSALRSRRAGGSEREIMILFKGTAVIAAPLTVLMSVLAGPILRILYPVRELEVSVSTVPLSILSAGGLAAALLGAVCVVFHAFGDFGTPIRVTLIGGALKLFLNIAFIIIPALNISGAAISAVLSDVICLLYMIKSAAKKHDLNIRWVNYCLPAAFSALGGGVGAYLFYKGLSGYTGEMAALVLSVIIGGLMYALMLYIYDSEDCKAVIRTLRRRKN